MKLVFLPKKVFSILFLSITSKLWAIRAFFLLLNCGATAPNEKAKSRRMWGRDVKTLSFDRQPDTGLRRRRNLHVVQILQEHTCEASVELWRLRNRTTRASEFSQTWLNERSSGQRCVQNLWNSRLSPTDLDENEKAQVCEARRQERWARAKCGYRTMAMPTIP